MRAAAIVFATIVIATFVGPADAFVYWTETSISSIGRSNPDGSGRNLAFVGNLNTPHGLVIDSNYMYWITGSGAIARANIDGTGVNQNFILGAFPTALAVDSSYIYWTFSGPNGDRIVRANIDGTGVNPNFITTFVPATGVAVDSGYIYWANSGTSTIGRATITGGSPSQTFISGAENPQALTVDSSYIYWVSGNSNMIVRANLDGSGVNKFFINAGRPGGIAVDGTSVWWADGAPLYAIGHANLNGSGVDQTFIDTLTAPTSVAVNALTSPAPGPGSGPPTITRMVDDVEALGLPRGIERSLLAKLDAAQGSLDAGRLHAACGSLGAYINEVGAQSGKRLNGEQAAGLVADAAAIRELVGCATN